MMMFLSRRLAFIYTSKHIQRCYSMNAKNSAEYIATAHNWSILSLNTQLYRSFCLNSTEHYDSNHIQLDNSSKKIPKTVFTILDYISQTNDLKSSNNEKYVDVIHYLIKQKLPPQDIAEEIKENMKLLEFDIDKWTNAIQIMEDYGFKKEKMMSVISFYTDLFQGKAERLYEIGESLRYIGFRDGALQNVICKHPRLLASNAQDMVRRYNDLMQAFKRTEIVQLALQSPNILTDNFVDIEKKLIYLYNEMGIEQKHIIKCNALSYSLLKICARHLFLERAGLYEKPVLNKNQSGRELKNPSLKEIVQFDDKRFATKVAGMTKFEYVTFEKMIELEMKEEMLDDYDGDESDDEE